MKKILFSVIAAALVGCGEKPKTITATEYLHDIDAARAMVKLSELERAKYKDDPNAANASGAMAALMRNEVNQCFPNKTGIEKRFTTANTDHDCLDKAGYKR